MAAIPEHFTAEEKEAITTELDRRALVRPQHDNDSERIREAAQRKVALEASNQTDADEYAECLYELGDIEAALALVRNVRKKELWGERLEAILRPDEPCCNGPKHLIRRQLSPRHGGLTPVVQCLACGTVNVTNK